MVRILHPSICCAIFAGKRSCSLSSQSVRASSVSSQNFFRKNLIFSVKQFGTILFFSWRIEERTFLSENAINDAEDETRPLLIPEPTGQERPMSPTSRSPRTEQQTTGGRQAVVGYISNASLLTTQSASNTGGQERPQAARNFGDYGSTTTNTVTVSHAVLQRLESPDLYRAQPRGIATEPSPRRFWRRQNEDVQQMSTSVEARDIFRPPAQKR